MQLAVLRMEGVNPPSRAPITLLKLHIQEDIQEIATGCDADIGGTSTLNFALDTSPERNMGSGSPSTARFWGDMRLAVRPEFQGRIRGGYAGFRTRVRTFGSYDPVCDTSDVSSLLCFDCVGATVVVWRDMRRRVESSIPCVAVTSRRGCANEEFVLCELADGRTSHDGPLATPPLFQTK